ncbi:MAG TPA: tRNA (adenosine(37)-N6)-threonylcarbamoyltransferase complex ATPase subunit type 1 TsaE [Acholeplasmataceae bacterium]|jgi:tRNA threonylcarbamoyladenosine biosynthesis protein TsaE|nr:tRNA (adenosine(37)-N6)-threonylcarbamoyltransferase complex ATPase subunit type 1 TsaE [Acholeplasmataceae bacterium]
MIALGEKIGQAAFPDMLIAMSGDLGAGKTTLVKGIGAGLGIRDVINSPTFTILKIYQGRLSLYHFDVYRLDETSGDEDLEEFFYAGGVAVIEWAENIAYLLPEDYLEIAITITGPTSRQVAFTARSPLYEQFVERVLS